jgi:hypothetical protein
MYKYKTSIFPFAGLIESKMRLSECEGGGGYVWNCTECSYTSKRRNVPVLIILMADDLKVHKHEIFLNFFFT